jgi:hypothetical protein
MWWLFFIDPEDYGKALVVTFILIAIFAIGGWIYFARHPEEWEKMKQSRQERNNQMEMTQYDTITKNDTTYIIQKRFTQDTLSIIKKIK